MTLTKSVLRAYLAQMLRGLLLVGAVLIHPSGEAFASEGSVESSCEDRRDAQEFFAATSAAESAFASLDEEGLRSAHDTSLEILMCLQGEVQGMMAAAFHRTTAMVAFLEGDRDRVLHEFNRARLLHLGYEIPARVAPEGHPLWLLYQEAKTMGEGQLQRGIPPADGWLVVDGVRNGARPLDADVVVQVYTMDGELQETVFLAAGDDMPAWGVESVFTRESIRKPAAIATGVSALATGVLYGLSWRSRGIYDGEMTAEVCPVVGSGINKADCLDSYRDQTNILSWSAVGTGVLTLGFGAVTIVSW